MQMAKRPFSTENCVEPKDRTWIKYYESKPWPWGYSLLSQTARRGVFVRKAPANPICAICEKPVSLESAKADEHGCTVHEECYVLKIKGKQKETERKLRYG
jgi:hypothetical protein